MPLDWTVMRRRLGDPGRPPGRAAAITAAAAMLSAALALPGCDGGDPPGPGSQARPVITVDVPHPTADKPQSKLWYAHDQWWAWLPTTRGSDIWRRDGNGWRRVEALDEALQGLTGRADVWAEGETVRAVLVASDHLTVVGLRYDEAGQTYVPGGEPTAWDIETPGSVETATIGRDGTGRWWVVYDGRRAIWARCSRTDEREWSDPIRVSGPLGEDDISTVAVLSDSIGVAWSDHATDSLWFRRHADDRPPRDWDEPAVITSAEGAANDHLNAAVGPDDTLYLVSKNALDRVGRPQLALHVRGPESGWRTYPYARRTVVAEPARPIVLLSPDGQRLALCHSVYLERPDDSRTSRIEGLLVDAAAPDFVRPAQRLLSAPLPLNNATSCKSPLPKGAPWIVFASDGEGNVYEARLDSLTTRRGRPSASAGRGRR